MEGGGAGSLVTLEGRCLTGHVGHVGHVSHVGHVVHVLHGVAEHEARGWSPHGQVEYQEVYHGQHHIETHERSVSP